MTEGPQPGAVRIVLFDRDGTLTEDVPYDGDPARVRTMPGPRQALDVAETVVIGDIGDYGDNVAAPDDDVTPPDEVGAAPAVAQNLVAARLTPRMATPT